MRKHSSNDMNCVHFIKEMGHGGARDDSFPLNSWSLAFSLFNVNHSRERAVTAACSDKEGGEYCGHCSLHDGNSQASKNGCQFKMTDHMDQVEETYLICQRKCHSTFAGKAYLELDNMNSCPCSSQERYILGSNEHLPSFRGWK